MLVVVMAHGPFIVGPGPVGFASADVLAASQVVIGQHSRGLKDQWPVAMDPLCRPDQEPLHELLK